MDKTTVTFRIDADKKAALDSIASGLDRDRSYILNDAVDHYLNLYAWQVDHIREGLREVQTGKFVPETEMEAFFRNPSERRQR